MVDKFTRSQPTQFVPPEHIVQRKPMNFMQPNPMDSLDLGDIDGPQSNMPTTSRIDIGKMGGENSLGNLGNIFSKILTCLEKLISELKAKSGNETGPKGHDTGPNGPGKISDSTPSSPNSPHSPTSGNYANNLDQAAAKTHVKFEPVVRGDEAAENAKIHDQASFARAVDKTALEYGLDPNQFRAQLEKESGAMRDYKKAMHLEGDVSRRSENNTSIGIGQISRKFLDGREWSHGGPNNERVGGKTVTTEMYNNSAITQIRVAASNLAMRIQDHGKGDLKKGLNYYVSGHTESDSHNIGYITSINEIMKNKELMNIGR